MVPIVTHISEHLLCARPSVSPVCVFLFNPHNEAVEEIEVQWCPGQPQEGLSQDLHLSCPRRGS